MTERSPETNKNPEIPKLYDDCSTCDKKYRLKPTNTAGYHYPKQPECDWMLCVCPHCDARIRMFVNPSTIDKARLNEITILEDQDFADEKTYNDWIELMGITLPKSYELTDRHEALLRKFGEAMLTIPDDFFWDNIESETNHPYNEKWL